MQPMMESEGNRSSLRDVHRRFEVFMTGGIVDCRRPMVPHPPSHRPSRPTDPRVGRTIALTPLVWGEGMAPSGHSGPQMAGQWTPKR